MPGSKPLKPTLKRRKTPGVALLRPWPRPCLLGEKILERHSPKGKAWPGLGLVWRDPDKGPGLFLYLVLPVEFKFFEQSGPKIRLPAPAPIWASGKNLIWSLILRKEKGSPPEEKDLPAGPFAYAQKETLLREIFTFREKTGLKEGPLFTLPQRTFAEKKGAKARESSDQARLRPGAPTMRKSLKLLRFPAKRDLSLFNLVLRQKERVTGPLNIFSLQKEQTLRKNSLLILHEGPFPAGGRSFPKGKTPEAGPKEGPLFTLPQRTFAEKKGAKAPESSDQVQPRLGASTLRKSLKLLRFPAKRDLSLFKLVLRQKERVTSPLNIFSLQKEQTLRKNSLLILHEDPFPAGGRSFPKGETTEMKLTMGGQPWLPRAPEKGLGPSPSFPLKASYQEAEKTFPERLIYRKETAPPVQREVIKELVQKEISLSRVLPPGEETARPQKASFSAKEIRNLAEALFEPFMERWRRELERRGFLHVRFP